jgi:hypothetical protein
MFPKRGKKFTVVYVVVALIPNIYSQKKKMDVSVCKKIRKFKLK